MAKSRNKRKKTETFGIYQIITLIYLVSMFWVFPYIMPEGYLKLSQYRGMAFVWMSFIYIGLMIIAYVIESLCTKKGINIRKISGFDKILLLLIASIVFSAIISSYQDIVWGGKLTRRTGTFFMAASLGICIAIEKGGDYKRYILDILLASSIVMSIWNFIDFIGLDPFDLYKKISGRRIYVSSMGNVLFFSGFFLMITALSMVLYNYEKNKKKKVFYLIAMISSFWAVLTAYSDSAIFALAILFMVMAIFMVDSLEGLKKYLWLVLLLLLTGKSIHIVQMFSWEESSSLDSLANIIVNSSLSYVMTVVLLIVVLLMNRIDKKKASVKWVNARKYITIAVVGIAVAGIIIFEYLSTFGRGIDLGNFENVLRFSDEWGTGRGIVWKKTVETYIKAPFINKLFGFGADSTRYVFETYYGEGVVVDLTGLYFDNAHNEYLQYLLTFGIVGAGLYITFLVMLLRKLIKCFVRDDNSDVLAVAMAVMVYMIQAVINLNQTISTPFFFLLCAIGMNMLNTKESVSK